MARRATTWCGAVVGVVLTACSPPPSPAVPAPQVVDAKVTVPSLAAPGSYADTLHGVVVPDPYRWLEDTTDAKVVSWVAAQRAYTDSIAQALLGADTRPLERRVQLRCALPYALEGLLRRELDAAGAELGEVTHGDEVELAFRLTEAAAAALRTRLSEAGQGRIHWMDDSA